MKNIILGVCGLLVLSVAMFAQDNSKMKMVKADIVDTAVKAGGVVVSNREKIAVLAKHEA